MFHLSRWQIRFGSSVLQQMEEIMGTMQEAVELNFLLTISIVYPFRKSEIDSWVLQKNNIKMVEIRWLYNVS